MSNIIAKYNISTNNWSVTIPNLNPEDPFWDIVHIKIGFTSNNDNIVKFNNLSFGYNIECNNKEIGKKQWPVIEGFNYVHTEQEFLEVSTEKLLPTLTHKIKVWCKNNDIYQETVSFFETPAPPNFDKQFIDAHGEGYVIDTVTPQGLSN
jgi:hypothetical protein